MHCYVADGFWESWLAHIARLRSELPAAAEVHFSHGEPTGSPQFDWQEDYIATFVDATRTADWSDPESAKAAVVKTMTDYLPAGDLEFLMELSVAPVARRLGLIGAV